jgi:catechol 2,3-dioxygenase-like lactoylglutathione lyase family enzyme
VIDHVTIPVSDLGASRRFYEAALEPLGLKPVGEEPGHVLYALRGGGWLALEERERVAPIHIAFGGDRPGVDAFHRAALAAGATDNGAPGIRSRYHEHYYAAYVLDADGHNVEAVSHAPADA